MSVQSISPGEGASGVSPDGGTVVIALRIHGFQNPRGDASLSCGNEVYESTDLPEWKASQELLEFRIGYDALPGNATCQVRGQVSAVNATGPNTLNWSTSFTTGPSVPLHYGPLLVGFLGNRGFVLDYKAGKALQRQAPLPASPPGQRPPPSPFWLGTATTASGRIPVAAYGHSASGPFPVLYRFSPSSLMLSAPSSADAMPPDHEFIGSPGSMYFGNGWHISQGGVGPAPTPTARLWAADDAGGYFYVEADSLDTLRHRTAAGVSTVVHQQSGEQFTSLRVFSH
ncbi:hypothetical protein ACS5PK_11600 [Roseateles sp. DB2]|uniref:hypothetical protein n=1 Tax=Roseateles sp. DB2 TaxID=3453717 RepID=UPI003EED42CF